MSEDMIIVANAAKCLSCDDSIYSAFRHDYTTCSCGNCSLDGGCDYFRMAYTNKEKVKIEHIVASKDFLDELIKEVDESIKTGRNARGVAYAALRAIRNSGASFEINDKGITKWNS